MSTLNTGRPITKSGKGAAKKRTSARKWYQNLSDAEKQAYVQRRSKGAQRKADRKRLKSDKSKRNAYHRTLTSPQHAAEKAGKLKQPANCQYPGCNRTPVQFHHTGSDPLEGKWYCARHNVRAIPKKGS
jgi:hypothetical protein